MPELRFDTHFQFDGLPVPVHKRIVIAVSGGSDSLALLHLLYDWQLRSEMRPELFIATVDHGLRPESAEEANFVANVCDGLGLPHTTLRWERQRDLAVSSGNARKARYELLCEHAQQVGATCIILGHTMDDQAETLVMRSARRRSTRGLSGMPVNAHYARPSWRVSLFRPLLGVRRARLQNYLTDLRVEWISDPSNDNIDAERVRVRQLWDRSTTIPNVEEIARLASLSSRLRSMVSTRTAKVLAQQTEIAISENGGCFDAQYILHPLPHQTDQNTSRPELSEAFAVLVMAAGGKAYRVPIEKLAPLVSGYLSGRRVRLALRRCLVTTGQHGARFERERRNLAPPPEEVEQDVVYDGRWLLSANRYPASACPFIVGMERFLPASDFPVHRALMKIMARLT